MNNKENNKQNEDESKLINFSIPKKKLAGKQPTITKIQAQKRPGRYNIFVDNQFAFGVSEEVLVHFQLQKGMEIPQKLQEEIISSEKVEKAYLQALNYLSYGMRTERQISDYLRKKEFDEEIPGALNKLKELKLIDDLEYSKSFVRTGAKISKKGPKRLRLDLLTKGVKESDIEQAILEYSSEWQFENARELAEKYFEKQKGTSGKEAINKTKNHLLNKGYSFDVIQQAIESSDFEMDSESEIKALNKLGKQAWKRYSRNKNDDHYTKVQKTKAYLFRKGFSGEQIELFISEMEES